MSRAALVAALCVGCANAPSIRPTLPASGPDAPALQAEANVTEADVESLGALLAQAPEGLADALGVPVARAAGARAITGEAAADETLREAALVTRVGATAAAITTSSCGNAWVVSLRFREGRWRPVNHEALVGDATPGRKRLTAARARACAMLGDEAREVVAEYSSESEEGDEARDPSLRVFRLEGDGALRAVSGEIAFGGTDDATGAVRGGEWVVEETFAPPRDLYVQVRPARPGPGGTAPPYVVRRVYTWRAGALVLGDEASERVRGPVISPGSPM